MTIKLGINGFGAIGRRVVRYALTKPEVEIVALNDLVDAKNLAYLLKYDSNYGVLDADVRAEENKIIINNQKEIIVTAEKDPAKLDWAGKGVDIVVESTGFFTKAEAAKKHLEAGAKKVIISAPAKDEDITIVMGVNEDKYQPATDHIISNASCTTNCLAPVAKVLNDKFGIVKGLMTTIHAYTGGQAILDAPAGKFTRGRAAALNMVPTTTGAAKAISLVLPELKGKFNGMAVRVPTPTVSLVDLVCELKTGVSVEEINSVMKEAAEGSLKGILAYNGLPLVSKDFQGDSHSSIFNAESTMVLEDNMVKVLAWYDNEWGYSCRIIDLAIYIANQGL